MVSYRRNILAFITNFLTGRSQRVFANGEVLQALPVLSGMSQGVALSPLYFAIFMGKVGQCIEEQLEEDRQDWGVIRTREEEGL